MSLVNKLPPEEREVPHEPGNYMSFRPLSGKEVEDAQAASARELVERFGPDALKVFGAMQGGQGGQESEAVRQARAERDTDPLAGYSVTVLLKHGLVSWRGLGYDGASCDEPGRDSLDAETRRWAALQVLDVSRITLGEATSSGDGTGASVTVAGRSLSA